MRRLSAYIALVVVLAGASFGWLAAHGETAVSGASLRTALYFALFGLGAQVLAFRLPQTAGSSISFLPFLSATLLVPTWHTVALVTLTVGAAEALRRAAPIKAVFNTAQICCSMSLATLAFQALGGMQPVSDIPALAYVALPTVYFAVNSVAVSGVVAISQAQRFAEIWRSNNLRNVKYDLVAIPVVYCFVQIYDRASLPGLVLLAVFTLGARLTYSTNIQLGQANQDLLQVMVASIELRDPYTSGHSQRVAMYSKTIARAIGLSSRQVERVGVAALLHDVGKIDQRFAEILQKPGRLTDEERAIIEQHSVRSAELVAMVSGLSDIVAPVRHHHERWDGGGYPDGLAGEAIPLAARIIAFADTIDAMTSDRPYRPALGPAEVRRELLAHRGRQFDPWICDRLLSSALFDELFAQREASERAPAVALRQPSSVEAASAASLSSSPVPASPVAAA